MKNSKSTPARFVVCVDNSQYPAALVLHKIYQTLPDQRAAEDEFIRVVDESGEDYLYATDRFVPLALPRKLELSVARRSKQSSEGTKVATRLPRSRKASLAAGTAGKQHALPRRDRSKH
jgi:hypothetical protein